MTYRLAALRFRSIGERSARFTDLTLDLTAPAGGGTAPHDSIVWLRNGGGKSSILSLLYAMLLPGANDFMGRSVQRSLTDYVDSGDTSHVVAVWRPRETSGGLFGAPGDALITGAVHEWDGLRRPAQAAKSRDRLSSAFYACHVVPGAIEPGSLPFTDGGGAPRRLAGYLEALQALAGPHARRAALAVADKHYKWAEVLVARGLDPEIFRIQKQMNHVEGGVEDLFKFASAKEFVDFLLGLTTPPDAVNGVAQRLAGVAEVLAAKPKKLTERDFCAAAADDLEGVAEHHARLGRAVAALDARRAEAARLASAFAGVVRESRAAAESLAGERAVAQQRLSAANTEKSSANDLAYLYRRQAARFRAGEAEDAVKAAGKAVERAEAEVRTWRLAGRLADLTELRDRLAQARLEAAAEEKELAPLRAEAGRHAAALEHRLRRLAERADADADAALRAKEEAEALAERHETSSGEASTELGRATADAASAGTELEAIGKQVDGGVAKGHLPSADADVPSHRAVLERRRAEAAARIRDLDDRAEARRARRAEIALRERELVRAHGDAAMRRDQAAGRHAALSARLAELACSDRLRDLAEATSEDPIDLWGEGPALLRRLHHAVAAADDERVLRRAERHADRRTIQAQERDAVLPTSLDAERVARLLTEAGIAAEPGWTHLRNAMPADRLTAATRLSDIARLGCGVVVDTARAADAIRLLDAHSTVTTSLVGLYTAADAERAIRTCEEPEREALAPAWSRLEPGLVDPALAEAAVRLLKDRTASAELREKELLTRRTDDDELRRRLEGFLHDCPAGHLDVLRSEVDAADARLAAVETERSDHAAELAALDDAELIDSSLRGDSVVEHSRLDRAIEWIDDLIPVIAERETWQRRRTDAEARCAEARARARRHSDAALAARLAAQRHEAEAAIVRGRATEYRREAAALSFDPVHLTDDPAVPLDTLRARLHTAIRAVESLASRSVLADRVRDLEERVGTAQGDLAGIDREEMSAAETALASPQGQEPHLRAAALAQAEQDKNTALFERGAADHALREAKASLEEVEKRHKQPPRRALPVVPHDSPEADALASEHDAKGQDAQERATQAETAIKGIDARIDRFNARGDHFTTLLDSLPEPADDAEPPFPSDAEAGRAAARTMNAALAEAAENRARRERELNRAVDAVRLTATRFPGVSGPVKDRAAHDAADVLGPHAAELAGRLRLRARTLTEEVEAIAADQTIIAETLAHLVKESFDMLAKAERASRMPTAEGSWAGKKILRIAFDRPGDADLVAYAERVIERQLAQGLRPEGMPLLKAALHEAAGPRGFTVKVLKPATDRVATTEDISRLAKWSGGEKLTVCVALYCTLAALRASGGRSGSGGVLLLDNPIGRASSASLVRLQRDVAAAHGVQLVYTTGVKDPAAVIQFPNVVRLENREGRTRDRRYIVHDEPRGEVNGVRVAHTDHPWLPEGNE